MSLLGISKYGGCLDLHVLWTLHRKVPTTAPHFRGQVASGLHRLHISTKLSQRETLELALQVCPQSFHLR